MNNKQKLKYTLHKTKLTLYLNLSYEKCFDRTLLIFQLYDYCTYLLFIVRKYNIMRLLKNNILLVELYILHNYKNNHLSTYCFYIFLNISRIHQI